MTLAEKQAELARLRGQRTTATNGDPFLVQAEEAARNWCIDYRHARADMLIRIEKRKQGIK